MLVSRRPDYLYVCMYVCMYVRNGFTIEIYRVYVPFGIVSEPALENRKGGSAKQGGVEVYS